MNVIEEFKKIVDSLKAEFDAQDLSIQELYDQKKEWYKKTYNFDEFETLILFRNVYLIDGNLFDTPFDVRLSEIIKQQNKDYEAKPPSDFECVGYMRATPGENDYSMFVNENPSPLGGGFEWSFHDFNPSLNISLGILEYAQIFIHQNSLETIKSQALVEERTSKNLIKDLLIKNCRNQLMVHNQCLGCNESSDSNGDCDCIRRTKDE